MRDYGLKHKLRLELLSGPIHKQVLVQRCLYFVPPERALKLAKVNQRLQRQANTTDRLRGQTRSIDKLRRRGARAIIQDSIRQLKMDGEVVQTGDILLLTSRGRAVITCKRCGQQPVRLPMSKYCSPCFVVAEREKDAHWNRIRRRQRRTA